MSGARKRTLADADQREQIRSCLDRNVIVEAAAGTGKTTELVNRIVAVLAGGQATVDSLTAVTFTEKAAGELKLRIRSELERARQQEQGEERARLEQALARLEEARVGTIHGFCADLLRERSVEARVDPQFRVMTEPESQRLFNEAFRLWLESRLEDPSEGLRRALRRRSKDGPVERLRGAAWALADWRDFRGAWRRDPFPREERIDALVDRLHEFAALTERCSNPETNTLFLDTESARRLSRLIGTTESVRDRDHDWLEAELIELRGQLRRGRKGSGRSWGDGVSRQEVLDARETIRGELEQFEVDADANLVALLQQELFEVIERYQELKLRNGQLDFVDLLLRTRDLVHQSESVRAHYQKHLSHVFVDEFQDTDPLQAEILLLLAGQDPKVTDWHQAVPKPGKLFLVADPKQSIYRFRRADVGTYFEVRDLLDKQGTLFLRLTTSFRSLPSIQTAVNAAFAAEMDGDRETLQAEYVPLTSFREEREDQPSIVALPVPQPYGRYGVTQYAIEASLPDAVGAYVDWLLNDSGWTVTERQDPTLRVPIAARHVCLLFRRFYSFFAGDVTRPYLEALEARGVRHLLVGGRSFHEREEVETIRTALAAIEWPDDELSVFATLRGSLFAVGDEELLEYRFTHGRLHPHRPPKATVPAHLTPITRGLELLAALHRRRNRRPVAETINLLLERTRAHAGFALRPSGEQVLANVLHVAEQARGYEGSGGLSFRGFVERLLEDAERGSTAEAPILEEGADGVRLMTVHKAKGLEFPVVILADLTASGGHGSASRTIVPEENLCALRVAGWSPIELRENEPTELARDHAEGIRLAYVAATRARDLLVVPALGEEPYQRTWFAPMNRALYPPSGESPQAGAACPDFGDSTILDPEGRGSVTPGGYRFGDPPTSVVWWDPLQLKLAAAPMKGIRKRDLIGKDVDPKVVARDQRRHEDWRAEHESTLERGRRPGLIVTTATAQAVMDEDIPEAVDVIELPVDDGRPRGSRFGALSHAVLATVPLDADREQIARAASLQARVLGAPAVETAAVEELVERALAHELLERARQAAGRGECRRETPITYRADDDTIIDGVVDLAFREDGRWVVVDFKTDRELSENVAIYRRQVAWYARAIASSTGEETSAILLRV